MGLAISTGYLADLLAHDAEGATWFREQLALVNALLAADGRPPHVEPERPGPARPRAHCASFPYSFLHYLRRAFARVREYPDEPLAPVVPGDDPADDPAIEEVAAMLDSHLVCHSDAEGYYVPVELGEVIFDTGRRGLAGGMLGSSQRLREELVEVAPAIGIELVDGELPDIAAARLAQEEEGATPLWRERLVWLALYEAARVSIANRTMIVFH